MFDYKNKNFEDKIRDLERTATEYAELTQKLQEDLQSQTLIIEKAELAYNTQVQLMRDKDEIISNQKTVIDSLKVSYSERTKDSDNNENVDDLRAQLTNALDELLQKSNEQDKLQSNIMYFHNEKSCDKNNMDKITREFERKFLKVINVYKNYKMNLKNKC